MADSPRRLSAVMLSDIVGYTSLTQRDEAAALSLLDEHRQIVRPLLREHSGREVKTLGDGFLVEFDNALDATRCAIAIQKAIHNRNSKAPHTRVELRIGLHVGDVVHENGDIYGDAVNIVSRVEPLAEPGGICVSGAVFEQVRNKVDLPFAPLGATSLKNVEFPVPLYRVELPWAVTSLARETPWVPRPAEQEILRQAVERAAKGEGSAIVLLGESGIGKTRLAEETIRSAAKRGFRSLRGRAFPGELATPYAHWAEMVREFLREAPPPLLYKVLGTGAGEVAKLVPELAERMGPLPPTPSGDPETARARFYEGVTQFFAHLSQEGPLLLVFDDLQWADLASLRLLEFALRSVPGHRLLLLGTSQEPEPDGGSALSEILRYLRKDRLLTTIPIRRMDRTSVGEMIRKTFGEAEVSEEFQALVHERTGGNPFFVEEVLRSLVEEGAIYRNESGGWDRKKIEEIGIPRTVRQVVKLRFNRLDEPTQGTMRVAAVLGVEFPFDLLRETSQVDEDRLIEELERVVRAGLLEETKSPTRLLSYSFTDPQLRQVIYDEMLSPRRARFHRKAAEALEKIAGARREEFAGDFAYHYREGQDVPKARDYSLLAAERWARVYGFDEAERRYRTTLELLDEAPDDGVRARVLDGLGRTHRALGRTDRTVAEWESAIPLYDAGGEPRKAGALCRDLADLLRLRSDLASERPDRVEELLETGRRFLERVPPSRELALLYDEWSVWRFNEGRIAEARSMVEQAMAVARAIGDRDAEMAMYDELAFVVPLAEKDRVFEHLRAKENYFARPGKEDWDQVYQARHNLGYASLYVASDPEVAVRWAEKGIEAAQKERNREWEVRVRLGPLLPALLWMGRTARARDELGRAWKLLELQTDSRPPLRFELDSGELALLEGDLEEAASHLLKTRLYRQPYRDFVTSALLVARLESERGRPGEAARLLREGIARERSPVAELPAYYAIFPIRIRVALLEILLEELRESGSTEEVDRLARETHEIATAFGNPFVLGLDLRVQARLAQQEGRSTEAIARLEEAIAWLRKSGNPLELGRTLELLSEAYRAMGQGERAQECRGESEGLLRSLRERGREETSPRSPAARTPEHPG